MSMTLEDKDSQQDIIFMKNVLTKTPNQDIDNNTESKKVLLTSN